MEEDGGELKVKVSLFASCREVVGEKEVDVEIPDGSTAGEVLDRLCKTYPGLETMRGKIGLAVNEEYTHSGTPLGQGDTLALIPPVSGGS